MLSLRTPLLLTLLAGTLLFAGCDSDDLDDRDYDNGVRVLNFTLNDEGTRDGFLFDRQLSTSGLEVQYEGNFSVLTERAVDEGVVLLYAADRTGGTDGLSRDGWTALPLTLGFDDDDDFFIDYTLTTTYTYDINRLYVNLVASNDYSVEEFAITEAVLENLEDITFKLVTIPGGSGFARGIDYSNYETVKEMYDLPD